MQELYNAKLSAYTLMRNIASQTSDFLNMLCNAPKTDNDKVDNQLLFEVYCGRADILITEDRKMRRKAEQLGISNRVYSINSFITKCTEENPEMLNYKALSVRKITFGEIDVNDEFFDTFRESYPNFNAWFARKCDADAYICKKDNDEIQGFLYLKAEGPDELYTDISPAFIPKHRLKVGTFKVESTGFRLGERFIKIIFDNAISQKVDEIYVTLYVNKPELKALYDLLLRWGFYDYGVKSTNGSEERVLVKIMHAFNPNLTIKQNFPNIDWNHHKFYLPIEARYHTALLPDFKLHTENEVDFMGKDPEKYALQKVYISFSYKRNMNPGDIVIIYRNGTTPNRKGYESVLSTIGVIDELHFNFSTKDEFISCCENRSVFSRDELEDFWNRKRKNLLVIKFLFVKSLTKKLTLSYLWNNGYILHGQGPRPFTEISNEQFSKLLEDSNTVVY